MFKSDKERLEVYKGGYKKLYQLMINMGVNDHHLTPAHRQTEEIEYCLHEIIGMEAVLGVSPKERIAVMDEILGPDLKKEVIPALKYHMLSF